MLCGQACPWEAPFPAGLIGCTAYAAGTWDSMQQLPQCRHDGLFRKTVRCATGLTHDGLTHGHTGSMLCAC
jgi:hypothetical protein